MFVRIQQVGKIAMQFVAISLIGTSLILFFSTLMKVRTALQKAPLPEAILVLGGCLEREKAAAQIAAAYPDFDVWVSTGDRSPEETYPIFEAAGLTRDRVHLDYRATDTVTNFTTLVIEFRQRNIHHLYMVTSDLHMLRAKVIAVLVLGNSGIAFTPVATTTDQQNESWIQITRDGGRSLLWIFTGNTGERTGRALEEKAIGPLGQ